MINNELENGVESEDKILISIKYPNLVYKCDQAGSNMTIDY
jgi:hypothetical protein